MISESKNGWITVYDETSESQDIEEIRRLGEGISAKLKTAVFCFLVHDSDIFVYLLYDKGKFVDQLDSRPDYFGPVTDEHSKEWAGNFGRLVKFAAQGTTAEKIRKVLAKPQVVEEERAAQFAALVGIDQSRARLGFKYAQETKNDFQIVHARGYKAQDAKLLEAVAKRDVSEVRDLLGKGASPNQTDRFGYSLLVNAIRSGAMQIAESLVAAGADVFAEGKLTGDAFWIASAEGHSKILELLLSKAKGDDRLQRSLEVALKWAVLGGHLESIRLLIDSGAEVNRPDEAGQTPLMLACIRGLEGAWEVRTKQKFPQRQAGPKPDWPKVVETLLKAGANPNTQTKDGVSPLMVGAGQGEKEICNLLLSCGADVNLKHSKGLTALSIAKAAGQESIVELLRSVIEGGPENATKE